jgi:hypothetical protein
VFVFTDNGTEAVIVVLPPGDALDGGLLTDKVVLF